MTFISLKIYNFYINCTKCGATIPRRAPVNVQVRLWDQEVIWHSPFKTCLNNLGVCDGGSWGASACFGTGITAAQLRIHTDATQWRSFLGPTQQTSRACLRRDSGASEAAWQIWAWPPWRERKGENWIYIFVFKPPYMPHWFYSSSECRLHVCIYRNRGNTKNMVCVSDISTFWGRDCSLKTDGASKRIRYRSSSYWFDLHDVNLRFSLERHYTHLILG